MPNRPDTKDEWRTLETHAYEMQDIHMRDLFAKDQTRFNDFSLRLDDLLFDYSKNIVTTETMDLLAALAEAQGLNKWRERLFSGAPVNVTENRAVLHTALRGYDGSILNPDPDLEVGGEHIGGFIETTLSAIKNLSDKIRNEGEFTDVVNIGIGGSDLGPQMVCEALTSFTEGPRMHFVSNVDGVHLRQTLRKLDPETTLFIVASKTFTTLETMTNAGSAKRWLGDLDTGKHMVAITTNTQAALDFGIQAYHILPMREWIGGRYSLWSAIGLPIAIACGFENFEKMLAGARQADTHFAEAEAKKNIPVIMALLSVWYGNFMKTRAQAILPYAQNLHRLPAYIQQLEMESNGKAVDREGRNISYQTAGVIFGEPGTNAQHAFFQLLHQGTQMIPCDFIAAREDEHSLPGHHEKLLANVLGQTQALMEGKEDENPHRNFPGNKPSNTILLPRLDPYYLGMLLALYEHKVFVEGVIWNINSFDQWGVELGKTCARTMLEALKGKTPANADSSTAGLLSYMRGEDGE